MVSMQQLKEPMFVAAKIGWAVAILAMLFVLPCYVHNFCSFIKCIFPLLTRKAKKEIMVAPPHHEPKLQNYSKTLQNFSEKNPEIMKSGRNSCC